MKAALQMFYLLSTLVMMRVAAASECGVSSTPCQDGCWNARGRVYTDGLRLCEPVSPGYYSPEIDDAQYPCQANNTACSVPCVETKSRFSFWGSTSGCSNTTAVHPNNTEDDANSDKQLTNAQLESLVYALIFSFVVIGIVYIRARISDCQTRRMKSKPRPIPPPPTEPKPVVVANGDADKDDATELDNDSMMDDDEESVVTDIEQG